MHYYLGASSNSPLTGQFFLSAPSAASPLNPFSRKESGALSPQQVALPPAEHFPKAGGAIAGTWAKGETRRWVIAMHGFWMPG
ncbi:hypothetical protein [Kamptonema formosum]|uniref:hypothetical protein n=1 Tax=Kamptonema formosum TaxID=331992 RepID=UPI00034D3D1A|nr:hypothetical protein [Oscillatoria sp. PCC 10802]